LKNKNLKARVWLDVGAESIKLNLENSLHAYLYDGNLLIDNNLVENGIRPNALERKNYLFAGSYEGAKRSVMFYSFSLNEKIIFLLVLMKEQNVQLCFIPFLEYVKCTV